MGMLIGVLIGLAGGGAGIFVLQNVILKNKRDTLIREAEAEGENIKKEKILQAKEKFMKLKEEHEQNMKERERRTQSAEDRAKAREKTLSQKIEEVGRKESDREKATRA
jgi:ribonuclease Y